MTNSFLKTPLFQSHLKLGARMVPFAGFQMPVQYRGVIEETKNCRARGGLFDVSHMGQFSIRGKGVFEHLQPLFPNNLKRLQDHQAQYNLLCNEAGGVIDDVIVYRKSEEEAFLCVNASNRMIDWNWFQQHLSKSLTLEDQSDAFALIALQGPQSESLLKTLSCGVELPQLFYYWAVDTEIEGVPTFLSRTGYTGEDGFELYVPADKAVFLWELLLEKGQPLGITPCGLGARDTLRLEMGYPLHGHELSADISPWEAGLSWVVKPHEVDSFIGKAALLKQKETKIPRALKAFRLHDKRIGRQGYPIALSDGTPVGEITSGTLSPHLESPIALGFIKSEAANEKRFLIQIRQDWVEAETQLLPFVPSRVKKKP